MIRSLQHALDRRLTGPRTGRSIIEYALLAGFIGILTVAALAPLRAEFGSGRVRETTSLGEVRSGISLADLRR